MWIFQFFFCYWFLVFFYHYYKDSLYDFNLLNLYSLVVSHTVCLGAFSICSWGKCIFCCYWVLCWEENVYSAIVLYMSVSSSWFIMSISCFSLRIFSLVFLSIIESMVLRSPTIIVEQLFFSILSLFSL